MLKVKVTLTCNECRDKLTVGEYDTPVKSIDDLISKKIINDLKPHGWEIDNTPKIVCNNCK